MHHPYKQRPGCVRAATIVEMMLAGGSWYADDPFNLSIPLHRSWVVWYSCGVQVLESSQVKSSMRCLSHTLERFGSLTRLLLCSSLQVYVLSCTPSCPESQV